MTIERTALIEALRRKKWTVGFAESCTGGLLSTSFTELPGISDVFMGSVVSYANDVKTDLLDVDADTISKFGAVSEETARAMARGARRKLHAETSIAITGIAGPTGGTDEKPVGTVWFAAAGPDFEVAIRHRFEGDRQAVQRQSVEFAMEFLRKQMK